MNFSPDFIDKELGELKKQWDPVYGLKPYLCDAEVYGNYAHILLQEEDSPIG